MAAGTNILVGHLITLKIIRDFAYIVMFENRFFPVNERDVKCNVANKSFV